MEPPPTAPPSPPARGPRRIVCDTSVLLAGGDPRGSAGDEVFVTPGVFDEVRRPDDRGRLEVLREVGLQTRAPGAQAREAIEREARKTGDDERLSPVDKELLALALEIGGELLTDDRSMQNLAASLKLPCRGFAQSEIRGLWHWESQWRCTGCGRTFDAEPPKAECRVCGHEVRKKHWRAPMGEGAGRRPRG